MQGVCVNQLHLFEILDYTKKSCHITLAQYQEMISTDKVHPTSRILLGAWGKQVTINSTQSFNKRNTSARVSTD